MEYDNQKKLLTIAIPTYNRCKTLAICINSIYKQILEYEDDVEFVILDNCSQDDTQTYLDSLISRGYKFNYIRNQENIGPDLNFLKALKIAKSQYVHIISDDDILMDNALAKEVKFLSENKDLNLAYCNLTHFLNDYQEGIEFHNNLMSGTENFVTSDKIEFMSYVKNDITFLSGIIFSTRHFSQIDNPEEFNNTNWLQSYIAFSCCKDMNSKFGIIQEIIIGVHEDHSIPNFNTYSVFGVKQKELYKYAYKHCGFNRKQLMKLYKKRCYSMFRKILGEKANGRKHVNRLFLPMFKVTWYYPTMWIRVYPALLVPAFILKIYKKFKIKRNKKI